MGEYFQLLSFGENGWGLVLLIACGVTVSLALCAAPVGFFLGLLSALMIRSNSKILRIVATVFSSVFRSLPELLTLFIVYFGLQILLRHMMHLFGFTEEITINAFLSGILGLGLVSAAFSSEIWLGAFNIIPRGQYEACKTLGLSRTKTFTSVIFPQLLKHALPGLSNNWLTLFKDTSLVSTIALVDIMRQTNLAASQTKHYIFFYSAACCLYLLFSALSGIFFRHLERNLNKTYQGGI
ncbi:ABC transporter permease [Bartonella tamiae]|uniref:His/Glu/Gln/Arg/opine family amino ABC transporter, permease, 3-TM region n=1 Tax=Bartonella tamiae Th239 TaxID=1094558 RepID=J1JWD2_9HYPH|nr:ABC transporter permease subunit [Bartonella tamiae]EJF89322.1 His/Glu/Gln/Arg/opine family amino ABC transporter, permease, 3-TM region [Bartonella tamiae Th239]EJF95516.1 His/Glu/Gln/Arg/opine family amino ABC transporter, permease, 3-TM region [Bartonella tamiae Th307]